MKILAGTRQSGKTTRLAEWVQEDPDHRILVVKDHVAVTWMKNTYHLDDSQLLTFFETSPLLNGRSKKVQMAIDDLEEFLNTIFRRKVALVSSRPLQIEKLESYNEYYR